nr:DNA oxidative demethylase ALKBH2-like [Onthophagus taurus]
MDLELELKKLSQQKVTWKKYSAEGLDLDYSLIFNKQLASDIFLKLEDSIQYYTGDLTKVKVFGKYHNIPRQQVAFGDEGVSYKFSGVTIPAKPWTPQLEFIRNYLEEITNYKYNFVLVNRYRNGSDHIGEHRDDEGELDPQTPIASLSLGQEREFVLKHADARKKIRDIPKVKIVLQHGSLLLMNPPTNKFWYHSLPIRKSAPGARINLTFRKLL